MDILANLALGFSTALSPANLLYCLMGVTLGTFIGVLPGVGPLVTIAVLLPLTYGLTPEGAIIMLAGIYYGAAYGGSTTAILLNLPGESSSAITCIDGYQMARKGKAGVALAIAAIASVIAGTIGTFLIALLGPPIAELALRFGAPEYFSLTFMALLSTTALSSNSVVKGVAMALAGVVVGLAGTDINSGTTRFTFGAPGLAEGVDFVIVAMGLFAFSEIITNLGSPEKREVFTSRVSGLIPSRSDLKTALAPTLRGTGIGSALGVLPGAGQTIASFSAYIFEKKVLKDPSRLGTGAIEGVAAPEAANNAAAQTSFIPTLTLGIPGSPVMALILGALIIQGITPGPQVMVQHPGLFWGLIASMWIGNIILVALNLPLVGLWVAMLRVPYRWLYPAILVFSCVGIYAVGNSASDVLLAALFGLAGYVLNKLDCPPAPFILGFVLGPIMELNMRRSLLLSFGDPMIFFSRPISVFFLALAALIIVFMLLPYVRRHKRNIVNEAG